MSHNNQNSNELKMPTPSGGGPAAAVAADVMAVCSPLRSYEHGQIAALFVLTPNFSLIKVPHEHLVQGGLASSNQSSTALTPTAAVVGAADDSHGSGVLGDADFPPLSTTAAATSCGLGSFARPLKKRCYPSMEGGSPSIIHDSAGRLSTSLLEYCEKEGECDGWKELMMGPSAGCIEQEKGRSGDVDAGKNECSGQSAVHHPRSKPLKKRPARKRVVVQTKTPPSAISVERSEEASSVKSSSSGGDGEMRVVETNRTPKEPPPVRCRCKRSRCLKLYCDCFRIGNFCWDGCACADCVNVSAESGEHGRRTLAVQSILQRRPDAFQKREKKVGSGCSCKNSKCLKLYCECFASSRPCTEDKCRCRDCENQGSPSSPPPRLPAADTSSSFTPLQHVIQGGPYDIRV